MAGSWEAAPVRPIGTKTYTAKCCGTCRAMIVAFAHRARFALVAARGGHMQLSPTRCSSTSAGHNEAASLHDGSGRLGSKNEPARAAGEHASWSAHPRDYRMLGEGRPTIPKPDGAEREISALPEIDRQKWSSPSFSVRPKMVPCNINASIRHPRESRGPGRVPGPWAPGFPLPQE